MSNERAEATTTTTIPTITTASAATSSIENNRSSATDHPASFVSIPSFVFAGDLNDQNNLDLFNDDQEEENLTLSDLQPKSICQHSLSIFDELVAQCQAVLQATNLSSNSERSSPIATTSSTSNMNDYEQRFQNSLHKLAIPSWFTPDQHSSLAKLLQPTRSKVISTNPSSVRATARTPEIVHVRRQCRSSYTTSPSPSLHSWHPNAMTYSMGFPSPSLSNPRRHSKYEKGIDRVSKSSHWYRPTSFIATQSTNSVKCANGITSSNQMIEKDPIKIFRQLPKDKIDFDDVRKTRISKSNTNTNTNTNTNNNNNNDNYSENSSYGEEKSNGLTASDKLQNSRIESSKMTEIQDPPMSYNKIELEEITDEDNDEEKRLVSKDDNSRSISLSSLDDRTNSISLEQLASDLVDSILADVLAMECLQDETNTGVRELSEDETALCELDENDIHETDEFIVFATSANPIDEDEEEQEQNENYVKNSSLSTTTATPNTTVRGSLNRLYTFTRNTDENSLQRKTPSNQDISRSEELIITDRKSPTSDSTMIEPTSHHEVANAEEETPLPIYRSHIQKRNINLGRYYDGMMRATHSQLPTHDLRCNLSLTPSPVLRIEELPVNDDGINEETVRKGRMLLDSINHVTEETPPIIISQPTTPVRSILKNTRFAIDNDSNETKVDQDQYRVVVDQHKERVSPRKVITTLITEEYRRVQRRIIEEYDDDSPEQVLTSSSLKPSVVSRTDQSPYESLSDCFSGYSSIQSDFFVPIKGPLVSNVSSVPCTTDEAYESDPTLTTSPTSSSSTAATTTTTNSYVHPELEHEFEYPSPPPPVPDRRLKPAHLRPIPPPTKPRTQKSQLVEAVEYAAIEKTSTSTSPLTVIQHLIASKSNETISTSARAMSSRHYCGTIPVGSESFQTSNDVETKPKISREKRNSKTLSCINTTSNIDEQSISQTMKSKRLSNPYFDEATNGLPVRLPDQSKPRRTLSASTRAQIEEMRKIQILPDPINTDPLSFYETSV